MKGQEEKKESVFVENKNVKDILVKRSKAYGNLQSVSTDIVLQEKEAKEKLTEEKIDSVEINKVKFTKEDKAYKYDEKERKCKRNIHTIFI